MTPELRDKLYKDFPILYGDHTLPPSHTAMCWGFDCGDGWFDLLYQLSKDIMAIAPDTRAHQVKEKFGTLRFYYGTTAGDGDAVYQLVRKAERASATTCEDCGGPDSHIGTLYYPYDHARMPQDRGFGWLINACDPCREKQRKRKEEAEEA